MSFVDFKISSIEQIDSICSDNVTKVSAYINRGHYEDVLNELTQEMESTFIRDERFGEVLIIFVPNNASEQEINHELYDLLLSEKQPNDEIIPECIF